MILWASSFGNRIAETARMVDAGVLGACGLSSSNADRT